MIWERASGRRIRASLVVIVFEHRSLQSTGFKEVQGPDIGGDCGSVKYRNPHAKPSVKSPTVTICRYLSPGFSN